MANWLRTCLLKIGDVAIAGGGPTDLRIRFETISHTQQSLGLANFIVSNVNQATVAAAQNQGAKVSLSCGYQAGAAPALLFSGSITETQFGEREHNTDPLLRIWAADGDTAYGQGKVSTTLAAGSTPKDIVDTCLKAYKPFGIDMGRVIGLDLSTPKFPRGYVLSGMVRDVLREVALSKGATWNLNGGLLNMIGKGAAVPGAGVVLNAKTGLIGQVIQRQDGIIAHCLINPAITVDSNIVIDAGAIVATKFSNTGLQASDANNAAALADQGAADGTYRVLRVRTGGDTRGNDWSMELTCIGAFTGKINAVQAGQGLS